MRYVQLRAFHYVALCGGFSRAAKMLHLTQPAVSDQVRKLEQQYDVLLFQRGHKPVLLTTFGEQLLAITQRLFDTQAQAEELLSESQTLRTGTLRIIVDSAMHINVLLSRYRSHYPDIDIVLRSGNSTEVQSELSDYRADLGVLGTLPDEQRFCVIRLSTTPLIAFVAHNHPLSATGPITLQALTEQALVLREPDSQTRQKFEHCARQRGLRIDAAVQAEGREAVREVVASGGGVGIVSKAEFGTDPRCVPIHIADAEILMEEVLVCLRERAAVKRIDAFLELARTVIAAQPTTGPTSTTP